MQEERWLSRRVLPAEPPSLTETLPEAPRLPAGILTVAVLQLVGVWEAVPSLVHLVAAVHPY